MAYRLFAVVLICAGASGCAESFSAISSDDDQSAYQASIVPLGVATGAEAPTLTAHAMSLTQSTFDRHGIRFDYPAGCWVEEQTVPEIGYAGVTVRRGDSLVAAVSVRSNDPRSVERIQVELKRTLLIDFPEVESKYKQVTQSIAGVEDIEGIAVTEPSSHRSVRFDGEWYVFQKPETDLTIQVTTRGDRGSSRGKDAAIVVNTLEISDGSND